MADSSDITYQYIGWCNDTDSKGTHDKIWVAFSLGRHQYAAWAARGKTLNFKEHPSVWSLQDTIRTKKKKYDAIDEVKLHKVWPEFQEQMEQRLVFCMLARKIK